MNRAVSGSGQRTWFQRNFPSVDVVIDHTFVANHLDTSSRVVDLGGHKGGFSASLAGRYGCEVHVCEPIPELFRQIPENPRIHRYQLCISNRTGIIPIIQPGDTCASVYFKEGMADSSTVGVEAVTYPQFLEMTGLDEIDLLKVDIEGSEIELFDTLTASQMLAHKQMTVEFHDFLFPELKKEFERISDKIEQAGFHRMDFLYGTIDVLYIRKDCLTYFGYHYLRFIVRNYLKVAYLIFRVKRKLRKFMDS